MRLIILLLAGVSAANADTRTDLLATLRGLSGEAPLRARVEIETEDRSGDTKDADTHLSTATAMVAAGADGLQIHWSRDQLPTSARGDSGDHEQGSGALRAMESLTVSRLAGYLNAAPDILEVLDEAAVTAEETTSWRGQTARLVTLKVTPKLKEKDRKYIKELDAVARIWLGADGVPLAAERHIRVKGRAMLVISFESTEDESFEYARSGDRLVVTSHTRQAAGSGAGERNQRKSSVRLVLDPPPS